MPFQTSFTDPDRTVAVVGEIARFIHSTATFDRTDRLWPAHHEVFATNPVGLAHGASGIALFLYHAEGDVPGPVRDWIVARLDSITLSPGIYNGAAGVAYVLSEIGEADAAGQLLSRYAHPASNLEDPSFLHGLAGWAWVNAVDHHRTGRAESLVRAREGANRLLRMAERSADGWSWPPSDGEPPSLGLGAGASGIALALAAVYALTSEPEYAEAAREAMRFELSHGQVQGASLQWGRTTEDMGNRPYWQEGGAGVGIALIRVSEALGEPAEDTLRRIEEGTRSLFTVGLSRLMGMSGIGEFVLDLHHATGDMVYLERAQEIAESVMCFRVERDEGLAFPSLMLDRLSNDFVTGSAGVGHFIERLASGRSRGLFDLP